MRHRWSFESYQGVGRINHHLVAKEYIFQGKERYSKKTHQLYKPQLSQPSKWKITAKSTSDRPCVSFITVGCIRRLAKTPKQVTHGLHISDTCPPLPAKGLRISRKTGFHIDLTVLAEFHIHDVVIIALDRRSRTPNEPQAGWNTSSTSIDQKTQSITNSQSKDIRYGVPASEIHWNSILWWCHLESFTIWAKRWSHGGVAESLSLFKWYSTPSMWSPEKSHQRLSNMFHITNNHKKPCKRLPKEGRIQDTPNKKLKMSDHLQRWPSKLSKDVTLGESLTFNTENTQPQGIPHCFWRRIPIQVTNCGNGPYNHCLTDIASGMSTIHMTPDFMIFHPVEDTNGPKFLCLPGNLLEASESSSKA